jgi:hypothetical protein
LHQYNNFAFALLGSIKTFLFLCKDDREAKSGAGENIHPISASIAVNKEWIKVYGKALIFV